jgi:hypothetical protein
MINESCYAGKEGSSLLAKEVVPERERLFRAGWYAAAELASRDDLNADIGSPFYDVYLARALAEETP